jgi:hypothetical protein
MTMHFYVLKPGGRIRFGTKWAYADQIDPVLRGEGRKCPVCGGPISGLQWLPPHRIKLSSAKPEKWGDFLWGAGFFLMVSDRFKAIYESERLAGITVFYPSAEVVRIGRRRTGDLPPSLPAYHLIEIVWNGANQDDAASGVVYERPEKIKCAYCRIGVSGRKQSGIIIEEDSWTGADIFTPRGAPAGIMVSERFKQVMEGHKLKNAWLIPAERYAYDEHRPGLWYVREE